jgi:PAS domain S-box-containing protein
MSKLLIIDDDEQSLYMLQVLLQGHGYDVESATNGAEALEKARRDPPDMIISDILMPVMDGFTLCRKLKQDKQLKHIPFVFYTATYTDPRDEELALKLGANRYLLKPIEPETFMKILHDIVQDAEKSKVTTKRLALEDEKEIYKLYNERLIKKLEKKMLDLEQEILERKRAEEALRESGTLYRTLITQMLNGFALHEIICDETGKPCNYRFLEVNSAFEEMTGLQATEIVGKTVFLVLPQTESYWIKTYGEVALSGKPIRFESYSRELDKYFEVLAYSPKKGQFATVFTDITERMQAEKSLKESEGWHRKIFATFPDSLFIADFEGNIVEANPAACQQYQYAREEFIKMHASQLITPEYLPKLEEFIRSLKASGTFIGETVDVRKDGTTFDTEVHGAMIHFKGKPHMMALIRDITERKQAEEKLQHYAAKLKAANAELSQYVYAVSHDLKAPLRAIRNYADFLREDLETTLDDEQKAYLDGLICAVQEAHALIKDLLELSQIDRRSVDIETIEVGGFFRTLIASLDLPDVVEIVIRDDWPTLEIEPVLLRQVFQNLIGNAVKFNPSSPKQIELGWQPVGEDCYEFFVSDNGIGIDPRYQEKIFRVFERLHTKEEFEGTGIGLAIVKKAVGKLGGSVRVESTPGSGSTFFVTLPKVTMR